MKEIEGATLLRHEPSAGGLKYIRMKFLLIYPRSDIAYPLDEDDANIAWKVSRGIVDEFGIDEPHRGIGCATLAIPIAERSRLPFIIIIIIYYTRSYS